LYPILRHAGEVRPGGRIDGRDSEHHKPQKARPGCGTRSIESGLTNHQVEKGIAACLPDIRRGDIQATR
jgi:hypothetical protein